MLPFSEDRDTPEIRLMRTIVDLNHRILRTPSADDRTALRTTITVLRSELVKLIGKGAGGIVAHPVSAISIVLTSPQRNLTRVPDIAIFLALEILLRTPKDSACRELGMTRILRKPCEYFRKIIK